MSTRTTAEAAATAEGDRQAARVIETAWPSPRVVMDDPHRLLIVPFGGPHQTLSWALIKGGRARADAVLWREVRIGELGPEIDAERFLAGAIERAGMPNAIGLLTARDVRTFEQATERDADCAVRSVATVGLSNAVAVGERGGRSGAVGTINILCQTSVPLSEEGLVEAITIVTEARTAATLEADLKSPISGRLATGTGTDCIVMACPDVTVSEREGHRFQRYAGKHTKLGEMIGATVYEAVARGIRRWKENVSCLRP